MVVAEEVQVSRFGRPCPSVTLLSPKKEVKIQEQSVTSKAIRNYNSQRCYLVGKFVSVLAKEITKETHIDCGKLFGFGRSKNGLQNKSERQRLLIENKRQACICDVHQVDNNKG